MDPDLVVKLVSDGSSAWTPWLDFLKTIGATLTGAVIALWTSRYMDRIRARETLKNLAGAAAAELVASRILFDQQVDAAQDYDPEHNWDTITYSSLPEDPTPLVRAAGLQAGQFPPHIAVALAEFMLLQRQFRQQLEILQKMHSEGVLTEKKNNGRRLALASIAARMKTSLDELAQKLTEFSASGS